jgi:circadian clock protein KaiB
MPKSTVTKTFLVLRLYVAGDAPNSLSAVANIKAICNAHFPDAHKLEIVDMLQNPLQALEDGVVVTPTLLRVTPQPARRVIGNLNDSAQVLRMLASK